MKKFYLKSAEYNITEHCNIRCAGCDHASPIMPRTFIALEEFERDLRALNEGASVGTFKLVGGEPTLHPQIVDFMRAVKEIGFAERLSVITNGTLLHKIPEEFWTQLDHIQVTFYPDIPVRMSRNEIEAKAKQYGFELDLIDRNQFRHTTMDRRISDENLVQQIYEACELPTTYGCHTIRHGNLYKCSPAAFTADRLGKLGITFTDARDSVSLHNNPNLVADIEKYMTDPNALASCHYCLGTSGTFFPHHQLPAGAIRLANSATDLSSTTDPKDLIDTGNLKPLKKAPKPEDTLMP